jgi:hypothetical protein
VRDGDEGELRECGRERVVEGGEDCRHKRDPDIE